MLTRVQEAVAFVDGLELPKSGRRRGATPGVSAFVGADLTKSESMLVGADIVSFVAGTDPKLRAAIMNCSLLAQLAANRKVPAREDICSWYEAYFDVLEQIGWVVQERGFSEHRESTNDFEANQAILSVASVVLGPATAALALVQTTLEAMKSMANGPWLTVFKQESQAAKAARFQVTVAEPATRGGAMVSLMAFELTAETMLTQVLFFKFRAADVTLRHSSGRVTIDENLLAGTAPAIRAKVADYVHSYVESLPL